MKKTKIHKAVLAYDGRTDLITTDGSAEYFLCCGSTAEYFPLVSKLKQGDRVTLSASRAPFSRSKGVRVGDNCASIDWLNEQEDEWEILYKEAEKFIREVFGADEIGEKTIYFRINRTRAK